jgi:hypothetical protein
MPNRANVAQYQTLEASAPTLRREIAFAMQQNAGESSRLALLLPKF